ncbi:hypothetical protein TNCT_618391, partial [Trichonephila clavata]
HHRSTSHDAIMDFHPWSFIIPRSGSHHTLHQPRWIFSPTDFPSRHWTSNQAVLTQTQQDLKKDYQAFYPYLCVCWNRRWTVRQQLRLQTIHMASRFGWHKYRLGGYCFGALMAWLFRLDKAQIMAVSIETAFQNPAVAFVMLILSLPQPEADLSSVPVIAQLMLTGLPMWALLILTRVYNKMKVCCEEEQQIEKPEIETIQKAYLALETNPPDDSETLSLEGPGNRVTIVRFSDS